MKKLITTISILLIATASYAQVYTYTVERVVDGDTIVVAADGIKPKKVHLIGIDAPESQANDKAKRDAKRTGKDLETINKMGQEATEFVKGLVKPGQEVDLAFDEQGKDKYGRLLAYVWFEIFPDRPWDSDERFRKDILGGQSFIFLNAYIIAHGYATPMTIPPNVKYADLFRDLYKEALDNDRGLWGLNKSWCEDNGGKYLRSINGCHMTATDEGKVCKDSSECEGACYVSPTADNVKKFKAGLISGECTGTATIRFGPDRPVSVEEGMKALQRM